MYPIGAYPPLKRIEYSISAMPSCRMLLRQADLLADSRARLSVGSRVPISTAMIPMTTRSSTSVNARFRGMVLSPREDAAQDRYEGGNPEKTPEFPASQPRAGPSARLRALLVL